MSRPQWFVDLIKKSFPGRFSLAKLTHIPGIGKLVDYSLFAGDDIIYLPRDETVQINQPIRVHGDMVLPSQILAHFIERANYHWVMDFCICRSSSDCQDYPVEYGCLFLGEAVQGINPKYGRLVSKDEALAHVERCREAGLVHLVGRNKLDTVWLGIGPGEKLLTICNCCPCCCLWRMLPHVNPMIGDKVQKMPGVVVRVDEELCAGCAVCTEEVCFVDAIRLVEGRSTISAACRGCGRCVDICPNGAIELVIEDPAFIRNAIGRIAPLVDLS